MKTLQDSYGSIDLGDDAPWGINTQRSLMNFAIGEEKLPKPLIIALLHIKQACAYTNGKFSKISAVKADAIIAVTQDLISTYDAACFPLSIWQTGSGTQTNMNVNEVIVYKAQQLGVTLHPNDDVNYAQSSNDTFPSALHIMTLESIEHTLLEPLQALLLTLSRMEASNQETYKLGRTHLQDATPMSFAQEINGWITMLQQDLDGLLQALPLLNSLAIGATAVGTGLNSYPEFSEEVLIALNQQLSGKYTRGNPFKELSSKNTLLTIHGHLNTLASDLSKIANDIRWYGSGPRAGLGELLLPSNEAGSSIMPGKVNPTQCEAMAMLCLQVMGNHQVLTMANAQGHFQLNTYMPLFAYNMHQSITLLCDGCRSFNDHCLSGLQANQATMMNHVSHSLMLATKLTPYLGYDETTSLVKEAYARGASIQDICLEKQLFSKEQLGKILDIASLVHPFAEENK